MTQAMNKFTTKQAGVIYSAVKRGDVDFTDTEYMYGLTDGGIDWNGSANRDIANLKNAVDAIFANDYEAAQKALNAVAGIKEDKGRMGEEFDNFILSMGNGSTRYGSMTAEEIFEIMEEAEETEADVKDEYGDMVARFVIEDGSKHFDYIF